MHFSRILQTVPIILLAFFLGCSNGHNLTSPTIPQESQDTEKLSQPDVSVQETEIYVTDSRNGFTTYQAPLAIARVIIDPVNLKGEITPARNASKIGDVFDADLTQYLRINPCLNCLQLGQMNVTTAGNILVEFKIKHPFASLAQRPDLHVFDVRGILISAGNTEFSHTIINRSDGTQPNATGNMDLVVNADGYTSHFDTIPENAQYFGSPRDFAGNINPFKRFFVNAAGGTFDPFNPQGHNVMRTGSGWSSAAYELIPPSIGNIDFVFVADCTYGQSAILKNRQSPQYFLPWFNRKEAWLLDVSVLSNSLLAGDTNSSALIRILASDWQAGLLADPDYPNNGLGTIPVKSDLKRISLEIPGVTGSLTIKTIPDGGNGSGDSPYRYDLIITNQLGAPSGTYHGIVAARDDIDGTSGPLPVPEGPGGFPIGGPDLKDYAVYQAFNIDVVGQPNRNPVIDTRPSANMNPVNERTPVLFSVFAHDPDGDQLTYYWNQVSPSTPVGIFQTREQSSTYWISPDITTTMNFTFSVTIKDGRGGQVIDGFILKVNRVNSPPRITNGPFFFPVVISEGESITIILSADDPDGDTLSYHWSQVTPTTPQGIFTNPNVREPHWTAPMVANDTMFKLRVIVADQQSATIDEIDVPVGSINEPPVGTLHVNFDPPVYSTTQNIVFTGSFTDPDGNQIIAYDWDLDYDGVNFTVDYSSGLNPSISPTIPFIGPRTVAIRATDNGDPIKRGIASTNIVIKGKWGANGTVATFVPPSLRIGSTSSQKAIARDGNTIHVAYEISTAAAKQIRVSTSTNGGQTFGTSVSVTSTPISYTLGSPSILLNNDNVWVAWKRDNDVRFARSINAGASFGTEISLSPVSINGDHRPALAYDDNSGNLYAIFADKDASSNGILSLRISDDAGVSFDPSPSVITDNMATTAEAGIAVTPSGAIYVSWADARSSALGDLFYARSVDGGTTFGTNKQVNMNFSGAGIQNPSIAVSQDGEAYFAWRDYRYGRWTIFFAKTVSSGLGVISNLNVAPLLSYQLSDPQILVNKYGRIYIAFTYRDGSASHVAVTSADSAGQDFEFNATEMIETLTPSSSTILCDLASSFLPGEFADDITIVWTDFRNGETTGFGDIYCQRYLREAY